MFPELDADESNSAATSHKRRLDRCTINTVLVGSTEDDLGDPDGE